MGNKPGYMSINEVAKEAALEAFKIYKQQEKANMKKTRLHNTGLLLNHYIDFLDHYEQIKYKASDIQDDLSPDIDKIELDDIMIYSIKRSKIRTMIMIRQIETAVALLKVKMKDKNQMEKYHVIEKLYMDRSKSKLEFNPRVNLVADELHCSDSSVRRWNSEMLNELSISLFGVDGLRLEL